VDLKTVFRGLSRNRFWILAGVIIPLLAVGWFLTIARLRAETDDRVAAIDLQYDKVDDVTEVENHPNKFSEDGMKELIDTLTGEVYDAWKYQYDQQASILVWPSELKGTFIEEVKKHSVIERMQYPTPPEKELLETLREHYRDYIKLELPKLAEIIGAKWAPGGETGGMDGGFGAFGGFGGFGGASVAPTSTPDEEIEDDRDYPVLWDTGDQAGLQSSRFDWSTTNEKLPTTLEILYAQEDLWVLKALMNIIATTNSDASGLFNGTIKEIAAIKIGRDAAQGSGTIGAAGTSNQTAFDASFLGGDDKETADGSLGMMGMGGRRPDPAHNRYVDNDYRSVNAGDLRDAVTADAKSKEAAYLVVAKRMPIRMSLVMDTRRIHQLITVCGNSSLMVEVRQVRINTGEGAGGLAAMGGGSAMDMMGVEVEVAEADESSGFEALGGSSESTVGTAAGALAGMEIEEEKPVYEMPVEIYGMIYIYNPVDTERLNINDIPELEEAQELLEAQEAAAAAAEAAAGQEEPAESTSEATPESTPDSTSAAEETEDVATESIE
jgi:hypothetical protein